MEKHLKLIVGNFALMYFILLISNLKLYGMLGKSNASSPLDIALGATNIIPFTLTSNPFCNSLKGALAPGPSNRPMIHAFVSNSGHFPFLHNVLLTMIRNNMPWTPLILSIGEGVCPMLANVIELEGRYICVPYLERLFEQLQRYEPESINQILTQSKLMIPKNSTDDSGHHARFGNIDKTFFGWGSVEHKFLINSKLYALLDVLDCGADAFITDTDIGFRKDPRPFFAITGPRGDIVVQNDTSHNYELSINSGFMYWKRTPQNLDLIQDILTVPPFWHIDQSRVNTRMYNRSTPHTLLDAYKFPNGKMYLDQLDKLTDIVVFHANWNDKLHEKQKMLQKIGLWFLDETVE